MSVINPLMRRAREGQGDQQHDKDRDDLGHEHQGLFLDLGQRLQQADAQTHHQRGQHGRGDDLQQDQDGGAGEIDGVGGMSMLIVFLAV